MYGYYDMGDRLFCLFWYVVINCALLSSLWKYYNDFSVGIIHNGFGPFIVIMVIITFMSQCAMKKSIKSWFWGRSYHD